MARAFCLAIFQLATLYGLAEAGPYLTLFSTSNPLFRMSSRQYRVSFREMVKKEVQLDL